mmetsp:Transcript_8415/g.20703  ORF Transcript_8415/g.20703 Transcript_8415/m.20703 type:complete len:252 (+) Transcript_8415:274-1029(+)
MTGFCHSSSGALSQILRTVVVMVVVTAGIGTGSLVSELSVGDALATSSSSEACDDVSEAIALASGVDAITMVSFGSLSCIVSLSGRLWIVPLVSETAVSVSAFAVSISSAISFAVSFAVTMTASIVGSILFSLTASIADFIASSIAASTAFSMSPVLRLFRTDAAFTAFSISPALREFRIDSALGVWPESALVGSSTVAAIAIIAVLEELGGSSALVVDTSSPIFIDDNFDRFSFSVSGVTLPSEPFIDTS